MQVPDPLSYQQNPALQGGFSLVHPYQISQKPPRQRYTQIFVHPPEQLTTLHAVYSPAHPWHGTCGGQGHPPADIVNVLAPISQPVALKMAALVNVRSPRAKSVRRFTAGHLHPDRSSRRIGAVFPGERR